MTTRTRQLEHKVGHRTKGEITRAAKAELKKGYSPKTAAGPPRRYSGSAAQAEEERL